MLKKNSPVENNKLKRLDLIKTKSRKVYQIITNIILYNISSHRHNIEQE